MKRVSLKIIHSKDTAEKVRRDALNKMIDEKIKTTPELIARESAIRLAITKET